ncbi:MAG: dihydrofolate reductase [Clostridiales bacterium]|jgi:dihydrofolate reductase|nr:dihydrofolate reductase [Clostridiales bacterium]
MKLIVAVCEDWGIGAKGDQPFYIPEDLQRFKSMTMGKVVVMGRVTLAALPKGPLKGRVNVVLTRDADFAAGGAVVCNSLQGLMQCLSQYDAENIFVIGGQQIYELLLDYCDTAYVTKIFATVPTDRGFPNLDAMGNWQLHSQSEIKGHQGLKFCYCEYKNNAPYSK